jgi:hypothetical protein
LRKVVADLTLDKVMLQDPRYTEFRIVTAMPAVLPGRIRIILV